MYVGGLPQHGPERKIELAPWQQEIVAECPELFLRGLFNSDGCRVASVPACGSTLCMGSASCGVRGTDSVHKVEELKGPRRAVC